MALALHNKFLKRTVPAFSLIEMSIVLVVIGIIAAAVFKGQELLENAKVRSVGVLGRNTRNFR